MNSRGALGTIFRAVRWPQCQKTMAPNKCMGLKSASAFKVSQSDYGSYSPMISPEKNSRIMSPCLYYNIERNYAVKKGAKKKGGVTVNTSGLAELIEVDQMTTEMENSVEAMKTDYIKSLSLRSAGSVESLVVKFEGKEYELQQVAKMTRKGQQTIVVDMLSFPQMTKAVADTLRNSALNLNPQQEGTTIFIPIPKVTKEHREILAKKAKALFITCRDKIKQVQEKNIKELRDAGIGDSEKQSCYKQVRAIADNHVSKAETMMKAKQEELLGK